MNRISFINELWYLRARVPIGTDIEWRRDVEDILLNLSDPVLINQFTVINYTGDPDTRTMENWIFLDEVMESLWSSKVP